MKKLNPFKQKNLMTYLLAALLACAAAVTFRRSAGIWMMIPIYPLCVAIAHFLPIKRWQRGAIFLLFLYMLNTVETTDQLEMLFLMGVSLAIFLLVDLGITVMRKKRILPIAVGILLLAICLCGNAFLFGNPISALRARNILSDYIAETYDTENGGLFFKDFRYELRSGTYSYVAGMEQYPNDTAHILLSGETVIDHFKTKLEDFRMQDYAMEITKALREAFPKELFSVIRCGIDGYTTSDRKLSANDPVSDAANTRYCIELTGATRYDTLITKATRYYEALLDSGVPFRSVTFLGNTGMWVRISVTPIPQIGLSSYRMNKGFYAENNSLATRFLLNGKAYREFRDLLESTVG